MLKRQKLKISIIEFFLNLLIILLFLGLGFYYRGYISYFISDLSKQYLPCRQPITYSLGNIDPRFNITKDKLLANLAQAENIWESSIDKQLFEYSAEGNLKINLIYDYRQKAFDDLQKLGLAIDNDKVGYDELKLKYESLLSSYNQQKSNLDALLADYDLARRSLDKDISFWNKKGGAPKAEYDALEQRRIDLNNQVDIINQETASLNNLVDLLNSTKIILNKLIAELNLQVDKYNTVGASAGKEFDQGQYVSDASGIYIDIFQFSNESQLNRVLAHELGHALGLEHIDNSKALMYYLNEGLNEELTADDLASLKNKCGIK